MREKSAVELVHDIIRAKNKTKNKSDKKHNKNISSQVGNKKKVSHFFVANNYNNEKHDKCVPSNM